MTNQPPSPNDMNKALFLNLIAMLSMSAMQALGKLVNPLTGKTEVSLDGAQATIDMLDMLEAKTRGNRDADEDKMLKDTLTMLKMNYVETGAAGTATPQKTAPHSQESSAGADKTQAPQDDKKVTSQEQKETNNQGNQEPQGQNTPPAKDPKFHKSYS